MRQSNALRVVLLVMPVMPVACGRKTDRRADKPTLVSVPRPANSAAAAISSVVPSAPGAPDSARGTFPAGSAALPSGAGPPVPGSGPREPLAVACYDRFEPGATPRADVARLAVSCGPSGGLTELAHVHGVVDESGRPVTLRWHGERGDCFRIFAVAGEPTEELVAEVLGPHGAQLPLSTQNRRWLVVDERQPFCVDRDGQFESRFSVRAGRAELAAVVYRGAHMVGRRR